MDSPVEEMADYTNLSLELIIVRHGEPFFSPQHHVTSCMSFEVACITSLRRDCSPDSQSQTPCGGKGGNPAAGERTRGPKALKIQKIQLDHTKVKSKPIEPANTQGFLLQTIAQLTLPRTTEGT